MSIQVPDMFHIKHTSNNQQTNLSRGLPQNPVTTRDRCVAHMLLRSCRDVRRPWHLPNAIITVLFRRPPDRGGIVKSSKNQTKQKPFFIHTYPGISCHTQVRAKIPPYSTRQMLGISYFWPDGILKTGCVPHYFSVRSGHILLFSPKSVKFSMIRFLTSVAYCTWQFVVHSNMGRSTVSLSRVVEYLCLATPGQCRVDHGTPNHSSV